jgi:M6 family metalloprotease-like protein
MRALSFLARLTILFLMSTFSAYTQVPPAAQGKSLPDAYFERLRKQPEAFTFSNGYISLVQRLQANRMRIVNAASPAFALAVANQQGGVAVAGTKLIPVITSLSPDLPNAPYDKSVLSQEYFDGPWPTGTMNSFYAVMSYGDLNVKGVVFDWQVLSHPVNWYAGDDYVDSNGNTVPCNGLCSGSRVGQLITELLDKNRNTDWGQFDNDGPDKRPNSGDDDGSVDFIVIVHPGTGGECGGTDNHAIWSHRGQLKYENGAYVTATPSATPDFGTIQINDYVIIPALNCDGVNPNPIGIASHEFGHAFDLPDLYDTSLVTVGGVGNWDLMATGAWGGDDNSPQTPTQMSVWAKERLGWISPIPVSVDITDIALDPIALKPMAYKISGIGSQYYLISNRQLTGNDIHLPKPGLLIEIINPDRLDQAWNSNQVNTDVANLGVQVIEADGGTGLINPIDSHNALRFSSGDVFPVSPQETNFDANSSPPSPNAFALCGIHQIGSVIHAQLLVSGNICPAPAASLPTQSAPPRAAANLGPGGGQHAPVLRAQPQPPTTSVETLRRILQASTAIKCRSKASLRTPASTTSRTSASR